METTVISTAKVLVGLMNYYAISNNLNVNIFSIDVMNVLWDDDKLAPTLPEFSEGIDRLCYKGILAATDTDYLLTSKLCNFSKATEEEMNEYAVMQGNKFDKVDIYDAREFLLSTGLARISADGAYITIR